SRFPLFSRAFSTKYVAAQRIQRAGKRIGGQIGRGGLKPKRGGISRASAPAPPPRERLCVCCPTRRHRSAHPCDYSRLGYSGSSNAERGVNTSPLRLPTLTYIGTNTRCVNFHSPSIRARSS